jgi:hypothetical protein
MAAELNGSGGAPGGSRRRQPVADADWTPSRKPGGARSVGATRDKVPASGRPLNGG